jgi:hypothetical protein
MAGSGLDYTLCQGGNGIPFLAQTETILLFTASRPDPGKTQPPLSCLVFTTPSVTGEQKES